MRHLRPTAIAGLLLAAATLSSCGFDYPTDRVNTIAAGAHDRGASIDALGLRVVSDSPGEGRLIGALVNNTTDEESLEAITPGESRDDERVEVDEFDPIEVAPRGHVNLADEEVDSIRLGGDYRAGDVIELMLEFSTGEKATLGVPVVKAGCFYYEDVPLPKDDAGDESTPGDAYLCPSEVPTPGGEEGGH